LNAKKNIMKIQLKILFASAIALALTMSSCYYDNEEDLYVGSNSCDISNVTYTASVAPVFAGYCNSCHSTGNPSGNIVTDNYAAVVQNMPRIWGAINHETGFSWMPKGGGSLSTCDLSKIDIWIKQGMPDN
jgi:hypothetical protein